MASGISIGDKTEVLWCSIDRLGHFCCFAAQNSADSFEEFDVCLLFSGGKAETYMAMLVGFLLF